MKFKIVIAAIVATMLIPAFAVAGDVIFIGNSQVSDAELTKKDVQYIFLGQKQEWGDGSKIVFAVQKKGDTHDSFLKTYIGKNKFQFNNYWKKQIFTGKGVPPKTFQSDQDMIKFVSETRGAIGYVSNGTNVDKVKPINVN